MKQDKWNKSSKILLVVILFIIFALGLFYINSYKQQAKKVNHVKVEKPMTGLVENDFPEWFPTYKVWWESVSDKDFLITPLIDSYEDWRVFIMDYKGKLKWSKRLSSYANGFRQFLGEDGNIYYAYQQIEWKIPRSRFSWLEATRLVLMDKDLNEIDNNIRLLKYGSIPYDWYPSENHEYEVLGSGYYILGAVIEVEVNNIPGHEWESYYVFNNVVQWQKDWKVIWQWESIDYPELYDAQLDIDWWDKYNTKNFKLFKERYAVADYAHMNAFEYTDDNKLLISLRNIGLVKVDLNTNKIIWVMSRKRNDIKWLQMEDVWLYQHDVEILDDWSFTIFDNSWSDTDNSRVCRYKIDDEDKQLVYVKTYKSTRPKSGFMGSAHLVNDDNSIFDIAYWWNMKDIGFEEYNFQDNKQLMWMRFDDWYNLYSVERWL